MKGRNLILTGLVALAVGVLMVIFRNALAGGGIVFAAGIIFVVAGLLNMTVFLGSRDRNGRARMGAFGTMFGWVASAAAVVLGLAMLIFSNAFVAIVGFMFGVLLLFAALFQLCLLLFGTRPVKLSSWFFLVPIALVGASIYIFMRKPDTAGERTDMLFVGISFLVFGLGTIIEGIAIGQANHQNRKLETAAESTAEKAPADDSTTPSAQ